MYKYTYVYACVCMSLSVFIVLGTSVIGSIYRPRPVIHGQVQATGIVFTDTYMYIYIYIYRNDPPRRASVAVDRGTSPRTTATSYRRRRA